MGRFYIHLVPVNGCKYMPHIRAHTHTGLLMYTEVVAVAHWAGQVVWVLMQVVDADGTHCSQVNDSAGEGKKNDIIKVIGVNLKN